MASKVTHSTAQLYIGIDIHKKSWKIHFCTDLFDGNTKTFVPDAIGLKNHVDRHFADHEVHCAYEAGCCGYQAVRAFQSFGWTALVVNPADIPRAAKQAFVKTDKIDCTNIAKQLRNGNLRSIEVPSRQREQLRWLFRRRFHLVKDFRRLKSQIKSALLYQGIGIPEHLDNPNWTAAFGEWLYAIEWEHTTAGAALDSQLEHYCFLDEQLRSVSNKVRAYCRSNHKKDYMLLRSVPGIGPLTAAAFLCEAGDLRRFGSFKQFASYIGMVPGIRQSGEPFRTTGVTPRGHRLLRSYVIEGSLGGHPGRPGDAGLLQKAPGEEPKNNCCQGGPKTSEPDACRHKNGKAI